MFEKKYLYLWLNILSFIFPFIFSFYPKANFSRKWKFILPSILFTAFIFILWDDAFTDMGVWGFNPEYVSGIYIFNLPLEEILFFFCIPYASIFTYYALGYLVKKDYFESSHKTISFVLIVVLLMLGFLFIDKWYTSVTFISTACFLGLQYKLKQTWFMGRFYFAYIFILIPFFIVNGILTGSFIKKPVVWYNDNENLGIRMGTIPIEDAVYGMLMLLMSIVMAEAFELYLSKKEPARL